MLTGCAERARIADPARTWQVQIGDGLATVGDEELLRRAVDNLLMNVLVHTPAGTVGTITACEAGGRVTIEVSDDGPGVPPDQLPHIFERFYRASRASRPGTRGSGLGLAIAAEIASAHGGAAYAAPAAPRGLRITLILPVREPPVRARARAGRLRHLRAAGLSRDGTRSQASARRTVAVCGFGAGPGRIVLCSAPGPAAASATLAAMWLVKTWIAAWATWRVTAGSPFGGQPGERRPADRGHREDRGARPGRGELDVGVQGRDQHAAAAGDFPPHRPQGRVPVGHHAGDPHPGDPVHAEHGSPRAGADQASLPLVVRVAGYAAEHPVTGQVGQLVLGGAEADVQPDLGADEHARS